jgi:hypothetical protein
MSLPFVRLINCPTGPERRLAGAVVSNDSGELPGGDGIQPGKSVSAEQESGETALAASAW